MAVNGIQHPFHLPKNTSQRFFSNRIWKIEGPLALGWTSGALDWKLELELRAIKTLLPGSSCSILSLCSHSSPC